MNDNSDPRLSDFAYQINKWAYPQAAKALADGYYIETTGICVNAINAILRELILSKVMEDEEFHDGEGNIVGVESYEEHPYLTYMLTDYENPLTGALSDRAIYKEAERLKVITKSKLNKLEKLFSERNKIFHRLFGRVILHKTTIKPTKDGMAVFPGYVRSLHHRRLKDLATNYLTVLEDFINIAKS